MPLIRVTQGVYESPNFRMDAPKTLNKRRHYSIEGVTDEGRKELPKRLGPLLAAEARKRIQRMERNIAHTLATPPPAYPPPVVTGADLVSYREALFPVVTVTEARGRIAAALDCTVGHVRHLESSNRQITRTTTRLLGMLASSILRKERAAVSHERDVLQPFVELSAALEEDPCIP